MALTGFTIFTTYQLESTSYTANGDYGYSTPIHSNYINEVTTDDLGGKRLNLYFESESDFIFLADELSSNGTGFTATKINCLVQVANGKTDSVDTIKPDPAAWKVVEITDQILGHTIGNAIKATGLTNTIFEVNFQALTTIYDLTYLDYPTALAIDDDKLAWGEEAFFFGTVRSEIKATAYTTDIPINLPLNEFNSTTNPTWDQIVPIQITEVGIYDDNNNLVAIGKLNYPISKDSSIARGNSVSNRFLMKNEKVRIYTIIIALLTILAIVYRPTFDQKKSYIETILSDNATKSISIKNFTRSNHDADYYTDILAREVLNLDTLYVDIYDMPEHMRHFDDFTLYGRLYKNDLVDHSYIIYMNPEINSLDYLSTLGHEMIHIKQYECEELIQITYDSDTVIYKNDTILYSETKYLDREFEIDAHNQEKDVFQRLIEVAYK